MAAGRCSGSMVPLSRVCRRPSGNELLEVDRRTLGGAEAGLLDLRGPAQQEAGAALRRRGTTRGSSCAVSGLSRICAAEAAASICTVRVAAGPATINSRCDRPTRKKSKVPLCDPHRHPQRHVAGIRRESLDPAQLGAHRVGRGRPPAGGGRRR